MIASVQFASSFSEKQNWYFSLSVFIKTENTIWTPISLRLNHFGGLLHNQIYIERYERWFVNW